jgi:hypothetical protein
MVIRLPSFAPVRVVVIALGICALTFALGLIGDLSPAAARNSGPTARVELPEAPPSEANQGS